MARSLIHIEKDEKLIKQMSKDILSRFPTATLEVLWDETHRYRINVQIPDVSQNGRFEFALEVGYYGACLVFKCGDLPDHLEKIKATVTEVSSWFVNQEGRES